jgi:NAD(P)-dependent dehydrogenase (short-subunit alcohol dehydrogenase family)
VARPLEGRRALVVGGGQKPEGEPVGIGRAVALTYAREGAQVVIGDIDEKSAAATVRMIEEEGGRAWAVAADIRSEPDTARLADQAVSLMGGLNALHNNVGVIQVGPHRDAPMVDLTEDAWRAMIDTNLKGMWLTCKHVLPIMSAAGYGSIVNVSSIASVVGGKYELYSAYRMSKAGVNALTNLVAMEGAAKGVRANALLVGAIDTAASGSSDVDLYGGEDVSLEVRRQASVRDIPLGRRGTGWDVARASAFLASDAANYITGAYLPVDGGQSARVR